MATATLQQAQIVISDSSDKETRKSPITKVDGENQFASLIKTNKKSNTHTSVTKEKQEDAFKVSAKKTVSLLSSCVNDEDLFIEEVVVDAVEVEGQEIMDDLLQMPVVVPVVLPPVLQVAKEDLHDDKPEIMSEEEHVFGAHDVLPEGVNIDIASVAVLQVGEVIPVQNLPQEDQIKVSNDNNPNSQTAALHNGQPVLGVETAEQLIDQSQVDDSAKRPIVADAGMDKTTSNVVKSEGVLLPMKTPVDVVGKEGGIKHNISGDVRIVPKQDISELVTVSANLVLADETRQGKSVIAKLDPSVVESIPDQVMNKQVLSPVLDQKPTSDNHKQSSDSDSFTAESLVIDMGIVSAGSEFTREFSSLETRSVHEQITSSIKEMLGQQNNSGKQEITINLFPEKLGAVKVEIISVLGEDGARKVESIKFTAEKRETLEILERSRLELEKSLKEVTSAGEKTSLEFEMNRDGQNSQAGAYFFDSFEERNNWMNSFLTLNDIDNEIVHGKISEDQSRHDVGHITEDSVDIRV